MALNPLNEPLGRKRAAHLLRRACFGGTKAEIDEFSSLTPQQAIEQLFQGPLPDPQPPIDPAFGVDWINNPQNINEDNEGTLMRYFLNWTLGLMTGRTAQADTRLAEIMRERVVFFLHNHFTTKQSVVRDTRRLYYQQALFRFYAFDKEDKIIPGDPEQEIPDEIIPKNFKELTIKVSIDNAMLRFLDGYLNVKGRPNENYARELLELYSIGKGLEGRDKEAQEDGDYIHFTEQDVQEGARVLSGFDLDDSFTTIDEDTEIPRGSIKGGAIAQQHDNGDKTFSFRFANQVIAPDPELLAGGQPTEESVIDEIRQLIDMIYDQRETAQHICRRLYRFFVYHDVSEAVETTIIRDMADIFIANDYKIQPVLEALFTSTQFYDGLEGSDDDMFGSLIKSPVDMAIGMIRSFEMEVPDYRTDAAAFYELMDGFLSDIIDMGMDYYEPFEVAGYPAYFQFPIFNRAWISTNYLTNRYQFIRNRISAEASLIDPEKLNVYDYIRNTFDLSVYSNGRELITTLISYFFPVSDNLDFEENENGDITDERLNYFLQEFLFKEGLGDTGEEAWTALWDEVNPGARASERLSFLFNALLQSPEYQLM